MSYSLKIIDSLRLFCLIPGIGLLLNTTVLSDTPSLPETRLLDGSSQAALPPSHAVPDTNNSRSKDPNTPFGASTGHPTNQQYQTGLSQHTSREFQQAVQWLDTKSAQMIRQSLRTTKSGIHAFPPQVGSGYEAFWLRDYQYMLEGKIDAFSDKELKDACLFFVRGQRHDGAMVDCIKFDGTPIYMPGYGSMGANPVADGSQFCVGVAWHTFRQTHDRELLNQLIDPLIRAMDAIPINPQTNLVYIDPQVPWDRCPYGFTDSIRKKGDILFCSLLYVQAGRQLSDLLSVLDRHKDARLWLDRSHQSASAIRETFWYPDIGLFRAATIECTQPDIWGSAFAVYLGVADHDQSMTIAQYFKNNYNGIMKRGQLRHTPAQTWWDKGCRPETYQNGAYWATPVGWFVYTLDLVSPELADKTIIDMVNDFKINGVWECINDHGYHNVENYIDSATLPLAGIRAMILRRIENAD